MEYQLKYVARQYKHGWSVWLKRGNKKVMLGSAIKTEKEMNDLITNINIEIEERYNPEKDIQKLTKKIEELNEYKMKYENLMDQLTNITT